MQNTEKNTIALAELAWETYHSLNALEAQTGVDRRVLKKELLAIKPRAGAKGALCYRFIDAMRCRRSPYLADTFDTLSTAISSLDCEVEKFRNGNHPLTEVMEIEAKRISDCISRLQHALRHFEHGDGEEHLICAHAPEVAALYTDTSTLEDALKSLA